METVEQSVAFLQGLLDLQLDALKTSTAHIATLRRENAALKATIAAGPSLLTELQDRVTLLESLAVKVNFSAVRRIVLEQAAKHFVASGNEVTADKIRSFAETGEVELFERNNLT